MKTELEYKEDAIRDALEHAILALNEGQYGECWMATKHALDELEKLD